MDIATVPARRLELRTLGSTGLERIDRSGERIDILGAGKPYALLVYLALAPRRTASRESLTDLLWANAEPDRARQTLRQTLSQLRHLLGDDSFSGGPQEITLSDAIGVDLDDFHAAMRGGRHLDATRLYAGHFLANFAVAGGESFDRWAALQRDRIQGAYLFALDAVMRSHLEAGHPREAEPLARALRDADPFNQSAWRLLIESLLSAGNALEARLEAEALERFCNDEGCEPEPATRDAVLRARQVAPTARADGDAVASDLIGREAEFAALLAAWARATAGQAQVVEILAPAGLGKTRLLEDLHLRLRARGSHAHLARAVWGERTLPFSLASAIARALAGLRGAAGISPSAARTLVGLDPTLSSQFSAPPEVPESSVEGTRAVAAALLELMRAVSDERPLALLVDDLHWADHLSLSSLSAIVDRLDGAKIMLVAAARPPRTDTFIGSDPVQIELAPLSRAQIGALVMSIAAPGDVNWEGGLLDAIEASTAGSPLLILETLRHSRENGLLTIEDGTWQSRNSARLLAELGRGSAIARRIHEQSPAGRRVLLLCAAAGGALTEGAVLAAHGGTFDDVRTALDELERRGLVVRRHSRLEMSHDQLREIVLGEAAPEELRAVHSALGKALAAAHAPTLAMMHQAARHLAEGLSDDELGDLYVAWRRKARELGDLRPDRRLAAALLGDLATEQRIRIALAARPLLSRLMGNGQRVAATMAGVVVVAAAAVFLAMAPRPDRLALAVTPLSATDVLGFIPVPVVEIRDQYGRLMHDATDTVRVRTTTAGVALRGDTAVPATQGRAAFGNVFIENPQGKAITLRFAASRLPPVLITLRGAVHPALGLYLVRAKLNGQLLTPESRTLSLAPNDSVIGEVLLRYNTDWAAASVMLAAVPTWGDRRKNYISLGPLVTPGRDLRRENHIRLQAPSAPGCYRLVFAFQAEDDVRYIVSGTNWAIGRPIWDDGNDIMDWGAREFREADSAGIVLTSIVRKTEGKAVTVGNYVAATTLVVEVRTRSGGRDGRCATP